MNNLLSPEIQEGLVRFLKEDIGYGDITSEILIEEEAEVEASVVVKGKGGVLAGISEVLKLFEVLGCSSEPLAEEGDVVKPGEIVLRIRGRARAVLAGERVGLNILSRMSGIATETRRLLEIARMANAKIRIACTRKTAPGLRVFDKRAVEVGGGDTHRIRLDDCVLIKDNHVRLVGSVERAVKKAIERTSFTKKVEVEVGSVKEALEAAKAGAHIIMLDNMDVEDVRRVVRELGEGGYRERVLIEVSGNIDEANIETYASTGADVISSGAITHSPRALDMSLEVLADSRT